MFSVGQFTAWRLTVQDSRLDKRTRSNAVLFTVVALLVATALFWDVIPARMEFRRLCETESGIRVDQRVPLDPEFRGVAIPGLYSVYEQMPIGKRYPHHVQETNDLPGPGRIRRIVNSIGDARVGGGQRLATSTTFYYGGGWFANAVPSGAGAGGGSCGVEVTGMQALFAAAIYDDTTVRH
jgi:hypothetical protein